MLEVKDRNGKVIRRSVNLRGIREVLRYVSAQAVFLTLKDDKEGGELYIIFKDGSEVETDFGSFDILRHCVKYWRKLYGAYLYVNGQGVGKVEYKNPHLQSPSIEANPVLRKKAEEYRGK